MTNGGRLLTCVLSTLVFWSAMHAMATETPGSSPYQGIVDRNVFGLKPPPPPPGLEDNKPPPPKIILQGITTILGNKRALMKVQMPARPPDPAKEIPLILAEGQRDGDIEVLEIDPAAGTVKVNNFGTITSLDFTNNASASKTASAGAPGGRPGSPGFVPAPVPTPFGPGGDGKALSTTRPMRVNPAGAAVSPGSYGGTAAPTSYGGTRAPTTYSALPTAPTYGSAPAVVTGGGTAGTLALPGMASAPATTPRAQNWPPETPMTPDAAAAMVEIYNEKYKQQIAEGLMPSIPGGSQLPGTANTPAQTQPTVTAPPLPPGAARRYLGQ